MSQCRNQLVERMSLLDAQRRLTDEKSHFQAEIDAFKDFLDRLDEIPPHPYQTDGRSLKTQFILNRHPCTRSKGPFKPPIVRQFWKSSIGRMSTARRPPSRVLQINSEPVWQPD